MVKGLLGQCPDSKPQVAADTLSHCQAALQGFAQRLDLACVQKLISQLALAHQNLELYVRDMGTGRRRLNAGIASFAGKKGSIQDAYPVSEKGNLVGTTVYRQTTGVP